MNQHFPLMPPPQAITRLDQRRNEGLKFSLVTASTPGAIAIIQLHGNGCARALTELTGVVHWPTGRLRLVDLAGIDHGLAGLVREDVAQIMPHGGKRVLQLVAQRLHDLGAVFVDRDMLAPLDAFPEARDDIEALTLLAVARASSPLAIDLLLQQPERWREARARHASPTPLELDMSRLLNRLITPPIVVIAGEPNVGKSTLSNALLGRTMSIASDTAGTTRDYVTGRIELAGLAVDWHDTPGLRHDADVIERKAIAIAQQLIDRADLLIAMRDDEHDWPVLNRTADLYVMNKVDDAPHQQPDAAGRTAASPVHISAQTGAALPLFCRILRTQLVPDEALSFHGLWLFDERLRGDDRPEQ